MTQASDAWMIRELTDPSPSIRPTLDAFTEMLTAGREIMTLATDALFAEEMPAEATSRQVANTEASIDSLEQKVRRHLLAYVGVDASHLVMSLGMMSICKDAERIGDYAQDLFELRAKLPGPVESGDHGPALQTCREVLDLLRAVGQVFEKPDVVAARFLLAQSERIKGICDKQVDLILSAASIKTQAAAHALIFRYLDRVASHSSNILTAFVQPLELLDHY